MSKLIPTTLLVVGLAAATALAGCGASPTATKSKLSRSPLLGSAPMGMPTGQVPGVQPGMGAVPGGPGMTAADLQALIQKVQAQQSAAQGFSATVESYEKGPKGDEETEILKLAFKRPSTLGIYIQEATGEAKGCKVLWTGGNDLKVKPSWLPFAVSKSISDTQLKTRNNWTIKDTCPHAILDVLFDGQAQAQILGENTINGKLMTMIQTKSAKSPKGSTHEIIGIDKTTNLPAFREVYQNQKVMYRITLKGLKIGMPSESELSI